MGKNSGMFGIRTLDSDVEPHGKINLFHVVSTIFCCNAMLDVYSRDFPLFYHKMGHKNHKLRAVQTIKTTN